MRVFGIALILLAALFFSAEFSRYQKKRIAEGDGFLHLFSHLRGEILCRLEPVADCFAGFRDEALERAGFLRALRECENLGAAMEATEKKLSLCEEEKKTLLRFCLGFGRGYREEELRRIDAALEEFERQVAQDKRELPRLARLVRTLSAALALGIVILLL